MATPLHPLVKTVNSKIRMCSSGPAQAKTRKRWRPLDSPMPLERNLCKRFAERVLAVAAQRPQLCTPFQLWFADPLAEFCTPFCWVLQALSAELGTAFQLRLPPRELPSPRSCSCVAPSRGHTRLGSHAVITPGRGTIKVTQTKPTLPLRLCLFNEPRKLQAWFLLLLWALAACQQ